MGKLTAIAVKASLANPCAYQDGYGSLKAGRGLPRQLKAREDRKAMPYIALPGFFIALRPKPSFGRLAIEMLILTGVRSQEVRLATWAEFDFEERLWTVPADHMKRGKAHLVALSDAALAVLSKAKALQLADGDVVFPGVAGKPMSDITLLKELRDMSEPNHVHGFRSAFTNWAANEGFPDAVVEGRSGAIDARCGAGCLPPHNPFGHIGKARLGYLAALKGRTKGGY